MKSFYAVVFLMGVASATFCNGGGNSATAVATATAVAVDGGVAFANA